MATCIAHPRRAPMITTATLCVPIARICGLLCLCLGLSLGLAPDSSQAQVVLRWGTSPREAVAVRPGAELRTFDWTVHADATGEAFFLDPGADDLRPLQMDPDFNLAQRAEALDGVYGNKELAFDGDPLTSWRDRGYKCTWIRAGCNDIFANVGTNNIDLRGQFLIDRVVLRSGVSDPALTVHDFRIHLNPSLPKSLFCCALMGPAIADVRDNRNQVREIQVSSQERTRFFQLTVGESDVGWEIHDIEVYGRGFVERATFTSDVVTFDRPMAWGDLRWSADQGIGARVRIQTRTGTDPNATRYWRFTGRDLDKQEVSRARYDKLSPGERAGTSYDHEHWSFWSEPYELADSNGTQMLSPGPRQFFQFRVDFQPEQSGGVVRSLELDAWPPAAATLVGEICPAAAQAGTTSQYTYALRPTISAQHSGFDRLEISSLSFLGAVHEVRIADEVVDWEAEISESHRLVVRLPHLQASDSGTLVEVDFDAQVLRYGASFDGRVWHSAQTPPMTQRVDPGDATSEFEGNRLSVATAEQSDRLLHVETIPRVFTPNGDGVNDQLTIEYDILEMTGAASISVGIHDLTGRVIRSLHRGQEGVGRYRQEWDGTDNGGRPLPPGVYLIRLVMITDGSNDARTEIVHVVR